MRVCGIGIRADWPRHTLTGRSISCSKKSPTSLPVAALLIPGGAAADAGRIEELTASRRPSNTTRGQIVGRVALGREILECHAVPVPELSVRSASACGLIT